MGKTLESLYYGKIHPMEGACPKNPEFIELRSQFAERQDLLLDMLSDRGQKLLAELVDIRAQMNRHEDAVEFINGFKLGARIMLDILLDSQ